MSIRERTLKYEGNSIVQYNTPNRPAYTEFLHHKEGIDFFSLMIFSVSLRYLTLSLPRGSPLTSKIVWR